MSELRARRLAAAARSLGTSDEAIYAAVERWLIDLHAAGDVLDFGAGAGTLTQRLRATGRFRSVTGADLSPRPHGVPSDVEWIQADLNEPLAGAPERFDIAVASEVIEHLENPRAVAREIFRLLRPGGLALLSTPNNESWRALLSLVVRGHFVSFDDGSYPAHITALVRRDFSRILGEAGFSDVAFRFTDVGGIPRYPRRSWQSVFGRRLRGLRFSDGLLVASRKPRGRGAP